MAAIGSLATSVIHDLNNLLTVIQLNTDVLTETVPEDFDGRPLLQEVSQASVTASALTRSMLTLARGVPSGREVLDLGPCVSGLLDLLKTLVAKRARFSLEIAEEPLWVEGDRSALGQMVMNLVLNAVDAGSRETIRVVVRPAGKMAELSVADSGPGIAPEMLERLFEPFFTTKEPGKGTGLGLHIVREVARQHGGEVAVTSEVGKGSMFTVRFPRCEAPYGDRTAAEPERRGRAAGRTILLLEDDPGIRLIGRQILERKGYRILEAENAESARLLWKTHRAEIDLLFTDLVLPGTQTGGDVAREFLHDVPELRVLFTSGNQAAACEEPLLTEENFLPKPFRPATLLARIESALGRGNQAAG